MSKLFIYKITTGLFNCIVLTIDDCTDYFADNSDDSVDHFRRQSISILFIVGSSLAGIEVV